MHFHLRRYDNQNQKHVWQGAISDKSIVYNISVVVHSSDILFFYCFRPCSLPCVTPYFSFWLAFLAWLFFSAKRRCTLFLLLSKQTHPAPIKPWVHFLPKIVLYSCPEWNSLAIYRHFVAVAFSLAAFLRGGVCCWNMWRTPYKVYIFKLWYGTLEAKYIEKAKSILLVNQVKHMCSNAIGNHFAAFAFRLKVSDL